MRRIMIIGGPGSGKSHLARGLGDLTGLPVVHIDTLYWQPGWIMRPRDEIGRLTNAVAKGDSWIFEGNHSETMEFRAARAQMLIFLDMATPRRLWRVVRRTVAHYGRARPDMAEGCGERFDLDFLKWAANYRKNGRIRALDFMKQAPAHLEKHHLRNPGEVAAFLRDFASETIQKE